MDKPTREELKDFFQSDVFREANISEDYDKIVDTFYNQFYPEEKKSKPDSDIMIIL